MDLCPKLLFVAAVLALAGCGEDTSTSAGRGASLPEVKQAEKAAEERRPLSDGSLVEIVRAALVSESSIDARRIDVENREGNVALHGTVASPEERDKAERIVMSVGGVKSVTNNLAIGDS